MSRRKLTAKEREKSLEKRKAYQREYQKKKYHDNIEEFRKRNREQARKWRRENPEKEAAIQARYNAKIAGFVPQNPTA